MNTGYNTRELKVLLTEESKSSILLPNFQREFVWSKDQQHKLMQSVVSKVPVGTILMLQGHPSEYAHKPLCYKKSNLNVKDDCMFLLDGQQRISTLKSIFCDIFSENEWNRFFDGEFTTNSWRDLWDFLPSKLRNRWFIDLAGDLEDETDPFGFRTLQLPNDLYEPADFCDHIVSKPVQIGNTKEAFHPGFKSHSVNKGIGDNQIRRRVVNYCAKRNLVPLWELFTNPKNGIHLECLKKIASEQVKTLEDKVNDGEFDLIQILSVADPDIESIVEDNNEEKIKEVWSDLRAEWVSGVHQQLEKIMETEIPSIDLPAEELKRGIAIFETVNKGGTLLSVFDLVVARMARHDEGDSLTDRLTNQMAIEEKLPIAITHHIKGKDKPTKWTLNQMDVIDDQQPKPAYKALFLNVLSIVVHLARYEETEIAELTKTYDESSDLSEQEYIKTELEKPEYIERKLDSIKVDSIKKAAQLDLSAEEIMKYHMEAANALNKTLIFLNFRCGVISDSSINYRLSAIPIAICMMNEEIFSNQIKLDKIEYWYWASIFSGQYRERQNEQCIKDIKKLYKWVVKDFENPYKNLQKQVLDCDGYSDKATLLRQNEESLPSNSLENTILQYILSLNPTDMIEGDVRLKPWSISENDEKLEDHHIIPIGSCTKIQESSTKIRKNKFHILNSAINRAYISMKANRLIKSMSHDKYLKELSDYVNYGHCIPENIEKDFKPLPNESDDDFFYRALSNRFALIKTKIKQELMDLIVE